MRAHLFRESLVHRTAAEERASAGLPGGHTRREPAGCKSVVYDMNADVRRRAVGDTPRSARSIARAICKEACRHGEKYVLLMFDDPTRNHEKRKRFHADVRYAAKPLTETVRREAAERGDVVVRGKVYSAARAPYPKDHVAKATADTKLAWSRVWPIAKHEAYCLVEKVCIAEHHALTDAEWGDRTTVVWHTHAPTVLPYTRDGERRATALACCDNTYGEADGKVADAVKLLAHLGPTKVVTIDTDMVLQLLVQPRAHEFHPVYLRLKNETIDMAAAVRTYGGPDYGRRLTCAFWMLAINGVDYCRGLQTHGFGTKDLAALAESCAKRTSPVLFVCCEGCWSFDADGMIGELRTLKRRNVKDRTWDGFAAETAAILWCLSLFSGAGSKEVPAAGPCEEDLVVTHPRGAGAALDAASWAAPHTPWGGVAVAIG